MFSEIFKSEVDANLRANSDLEIESLACTQKENLHDRLFEFQKILFDACAFVKHVNKNAPPVGTRHKLHVVSSCIKAIRTQDHEHYRLLADRYPPCADIHVCNWNVCPKFKALEKHFLELAQQDSLETSRNHDLDESLEETNQHIEFGGLRSAYAALYRFAPASYCTISAIITNDGTQGEAPKFATDPDTIASVLNVHWGNTAKAPDPPPENPNEFLSVIQDFAKCSLEQLSPSIEETEYILSHASDSSVGPDGIPYSGYKVCKREIAILIMLFIQSLFCGNFEFEESVLLAFMVFLPKKATILGPGGLKLYAPKDTRPLSLGNTFVKLIAIVLKTCLCRVVDPLLHPAQKCVRGRNILDNVIQLDSIMHELAIAAPNDALAIFGT